MAMTPERRVKKQVVEALKSFGSDLYYFFPVTGGFGKSGVPDIVGCYRGVFFAIECKAKNNKPTPLQQREIGAIHEAGGFAWVVNEDNAKDVRAMLVTQYQEMFGG